MRRRNSFRLCVGVCEILELRTCPSSMWSSMEGFLTIMAPSPTSVVRATQYDHQMVVQVDTETPVIFDGDAARYMAALAPNGEYLTSLEIILMPSVAGDAVLARSRTLEDDAFTALWSQNTDGFVDDVSDDDASAIAVDDDLSIIMDDYDDSIIMDDYDDLFSASVEVDDLPEEASEDELVAVDSDVAITDDIDLQQEEAFDGGFQIALAEIFSDWNAHPIDATL